ncbi:MAG: sigma-70 family RNA polymerase sigma factor [Saprospiraceae bacterium]
MIFKRKYTEEELVAGCVANDRLWQERLYRRFFPTMMEMCLRRTNDQEEAMTIVNNGFLRVFKKIHLYSFKGSLEGWIRRLVWHSLADHFRGQPKSVHYLIFEERDQVETTSAASNLYFEDLVKMVELLPDATKEVFRLYAIEGFSHKEIGLQLGISDGTSKWHLSAARKKLKELIYKHDLRNYAG